MTEWELERLRWRNERWERDHPDQVLIAKCDRCGLGYVWRPDGTPWPCIACGGRVVALAASPETGIER